jgi:hypothetical protein
MEIVVNAVDAIALVAAADVVVNANVIVINVLVVIAVFKRSGL